VAEKLVILITGASSGFGRNAALNLLDSGHSVYAASRNLKKMKDLEEKGAKILKMDVTLDSEISSCVNQIIKEQGKIDVLINNAGQGSYGMIEAVPLEKVKYQFDVNVFGMGRMIQAVLPHMRKQKSGRIVITSSLASHLSTLGLGWYAASKHALRAMANSLRQEVKMLGIDVVMIEPGAVKTGFGEIALANYDETNPPEEYKELHGNFKKYLVNMYKNGPGPEKTAEVIAKAATIKRPRALYRTTFDAVLFPIIQLLTSIRILDTAIHFLVKFAGKKK
jgi:short-subunit dehydrogenase